MATSPKTPPNDLGALEFEFTDLDSARQALSELPPGVDRLHGLQPDYWEKKRRSPLATDRMLTVRTVEWMEALPTSVRPNQLAARYPRLVNEIADTWSSAQQCLATFEELSADRRGGRRGFAFAIEVELRNLRSYRAGLGRK